MEYWSPASLLEGDPGKDAAAPSELRQLAEEEAEFSSDSSVGSEPKVPREEIANRVACIMVGQIRDKGCPKAHCLKWPTDAVSFS